MIRFEKISVRNFSSFGNVPTEVNLNTGLTLVQGRNGTGKSSLVTDALTFALYGKPFKDINLPKLINNFNKGDCIVELWFSINKDSFHIKRGLKPGVFEVYENGVLVPQEASSRDYQRLLENEILKISYKTFTQILVLGSAKYQPFMKLNPHQRREFINEILDIRIIRVLYDMCNVDLKNLKTDIKIKNSEVASLKAETLGQKKVLESLVSNSTTRTSALEEDLAEVTSKIETLASDIRNQEQELAGERIKVEALDKTKDLQNLNIEISIQKKKKEDHEETLKYLLDIDECPTCKQCVKEAHKGHLAALANSSIESIEKSLSALSDTFLTISSEQDVFLTTKKALEDTQCQIDLLKSDLRELIGKKVSTEKQIEAQKANSEKDVLELKEIMAKTADRALTTLKELSSLEKTVQILELCKELFSDSGLKRKIIEMYLPKINKEVNHTLEELELFCKFSLDENFNETILHKEREAMEYNSMSEGEKRRIDIALMNAFRQVCAMRSVTSTNLLVLDEMDSGLDFDGRAQFVELVKSMSPNSWLISHAIRGSGLEQVFDTVIGVDKVGDFTVLDVH